MRLRNLGAVGITGIFAVIAGFFLIWRHRSDILGWCGAYIREFRAELERRGAAERTNPGASKMIASFRTQLPQGALAIVAGISLIIAGQLALYLDLLS